MYDITHLNIATVTNFINFWKVSIWRDFNSNIFIVVTITQTKMNYSTFL